MKTAESRGGVTWVLLGAVAAAVLIKPAEASGAVKSALELCAGVVLPSLFPFTVLSGMAVRLGLGQKLEKVITPVMRPLFGVGGAGAAAYALGILGGYPTGARTAAELYKSGGCTRDEAERLLCFTGFCGPGFILGVAGAGVFGSVAAGAVLMAVHILSGTLCGVIFRGKGSIAAAVSEKTAAPPPPGAQAFVESVTAAFRGCIDLCAIVTFALVVLRLLESVGFIGLCGRAAALLGVPEEWTARAVTGIVEMSSGVWSLAGCSERYPTASFVMASFFIGWGGLSVHFQVMSVLAGTDLSTGRYLAAKLLHGALAAALAVPLSALVPAGESAAAAVFAAQTAVPTAGMVTAAMAGALAVAAEVKKERAAHLKTGANGCIMASREEE